MKVALAQLNTTLPADNVTCDSDTHCTVLTPGGSGTVDVRATVAGQTSAITTPRRAT